MNGRIEIYRDASAQWRWRIRARNGRIIATPGEAFTRKAECRKSITRVLRVLQKLSMIA